MSLGTNWRSGYGYPDPLNGSLNRWAWEFLRRSDRYQVVWRDYQSLVEEIVPGFDGDFSTLNATNPELARQHYITMNKDERMWEYSPPRLEEESKRDWRRRAKKTRMRLISLALGESFGLEKLTPPWHSYSSLNIRFHGRPGHVQMFEYGDMSTREDGCHQHAFIVDYRFPIAPQLAGIKRFATKERASRVDDGKVKKWPDRRIRADEWLNYLRLLDGLSEGASSAEIGGVLFPTDDNSPPSYGRTKRVNNSIKAARELCEEGYRYIPWMKK